MYFKHAVARLGAVATAALFVPVSAFEQPGPSRPASIEAVFVRSIGGGPFDEGQLDNATGIAVDATGKVFVADYTNNRVHVFQLRSRWGKSRRLSLRA